MSQASPTVAGWELMLRIRRQAEDRGVKVHAVARALDVSAQYWSQLTKGKGTLTESKLNTLLDLLEFDRDDRAELLALREIAKGRNPYGEYSALFPDPLMRLFGLEAGARSIRSFENAVVPGLLQTEDYVRALMKASVTIGRQIEIEHRVRGRLQRQRRLTEDPILLSVVMGQAALTYQVGSPDVHKAQLLHLLELSEQHSDRLDIRVIPFESGGTSIASLNSATFHLLDFESSRLPTLGWMETALYGELVEDSKRVGALEYLYEQLHAVALSTDDSRKLIKRVAGQIC
ncbi:helix-turn-helix domain-containing protein [Nocardia terpenica]|uniref:Helix-turn-helix domain-containing protein n=1 Tax=Nocardia terpenica TaxID=455432 RepID=A0A6G9YW91_9NOCA|nr:helix-turn-helix transcriptional regulator [Nocardia terpenica]QIS17609.1 helix-turn-helix domain-containing protein [Nocardia terpenica]